jgi:ATP-dependent DNA ligase
VVKGASTLYRPNQRRWIKVKSRSTIELTLGAVIGPISRPESVVAGVMRDGVLVIAGRSVPLSAAQAASLAAVLVPSGAEHPWPDTIAANRFGAGRDRVVLTKVEPTVVIEVAADTALQAGVHRHPLRYLRHRPDLTVDDLSPSS